jgi:tRNA-splicing ligase RtcB
MLKKGRQFGVDYSIWGEELIDPKAIDQFGQCLVEDWVVKGAGMPDMHVGYAMPIGGVIETFGQVVPAWVGYDIGCGVCYVQTTYHPHECFSLNKEIYAMIRQVVPTGFNHHHRPVRKDSPLTATAQPTKWWMENYEDRKGQCQLGTMGGNNHFIEVGTNNTGHVCFVIHSGSRGIGADTAKHYMRIAGGGKIREGNYPLALRSGLGEAYIRDMNACLDFALTNRQIMLQEIERGMDSLGLVGGIEWGSLINNTHNHAEVNHDRVIHRKGATKADDGVKGVIPGNPQVGSYIVRGRGNAASLCSSSHGAGRIGSRKQAKVTLSVSDYQNDMAGIVAHVGPATLDEAPRAYKAFDRVMDAQADLVQTIDQVKPFICIKDIKRGNVKYGK